MGLDINFSFPVDSVYSKEEIQQNFWKCLYTSADKEMLHYWVFLPKRLQPADLDPVTIPEVRLINIGRYISNPESASYLEVWAAYEHCPWEMNASDWLLNRLALMGEKILNQRIIVNSSTSGNYADILTIKTHSSGDEVISRYTVQKDYNPQDAGGNYFLLKASCASRDYAALANDIYLIVTNWDLSHRSNLATAELLSNVNLNQNSTFKIPASWKAKTISENRLTVEHTINGINYGVINYYFYPEASFQSPNEVFSASVERFHQPDNGVTLTTDEMQIIPNEINEASGYVFYVCTGEIFSVKENMRAFYQMIIFKQAGLWNYVEQVGKHRNFDDYHFEANKRCLELIVATVKLVTN